MLVLDASRTLTFCFDDERDEATDALFARIEVDGSVVPSIWPLEVTNGLRSAIRRGRISTHDLPRLRSLLRDLRVEVDDQAPLAAFGETLDLALAHDLSAYDATYLGLAMRRDLPLATADARLRAACQQAGVVVAD